MIEIGPCAVRATAARVNEVQKLPRLLKVLIPLQERIVIERSKDRKQAQLLTTAQKELEG